MNLNYRLRLVTAAFLLLGFASSAQNSSVSIGTSNTNASAVLWLNSPGQNQGLIIPVGSRTNVATPVKGMLIFDTSEVYAYDGTNWNTVGGSGGGSGSTYSLSYNASTKVITLNPNISGTATIDISTTTLSGGDLGGTLGIPSVTGILGKSITLPNSGVQYLSYDVTQAKWVFQTPSGSLPAAGVNQILTSNASSIPTWASAIPGSQVTPNFGAQNISTTGTLSSGATTVTGLIVTGATTSFNNKIYTWPNNPTLTAGTFLKTDAAGNLSWAAAGAALPVLTNNQLLSNNGTTNLGVTVGGDLTYSVVGTTGSFVIGGTPATGNNIVTAINASSSTINSTKLGTVAIAQGGTGATTAAGALTNLGALSNPMTSAGDIIYGGAAGVATRLAGGATGVLKSNGTTPSWSTIVDADINTSGITTAGKVSGSAITSGTIGGSTVINTSGDIISTGGSLSISGTTTFGGIKYTWPTTPLAASTTYLSTDNNGNLSWVNGSTGWGLSGNSLGGTEFIGSTNPSDLIFKTNNTEWARLNTSGYLGIGTNIPGSVLHAAWNLTSNINPIATIEALGTNSAASMRFRNSSGQSYAMGILSTGDFAISTLNNNVSVSDAIRISSGGFVGIGTATPASKLTLSGGNFAIDNTYQLLAKNSAGTYEPYMWPRYSDNIMYLNYGSGGFQIRNNGSVSTMFMSSSNNVGIGTSSPSYLLHVNGSSSVNTFNVANSTTGAFSSSSTFNGGVLFQKQLILNSATNVTGSIVSTFDDVYDLGTSANRWGTVYAGTGTIQTSDIRLKENVRSLNYGLDEVMDLRPVSYTWKKDSTHKINLGLIAQEVLKVVPEAVNVPKDGSYLGMNYSNLVPVLIKAVQEQQKLIDEQKKQIEELKGQQNQKETTAQSELNQLKFEIANIKKALGIEANAKKK